MGNHSRVRRSHSVPCNHDIGSPWAQSSLYVRKAALNRRNVFLAPAAFGKYTPFWFRVVATEQDQYAGVEN